MECTFCLLISHHFLLIKNSANFNTNVTSVIPLARNNVPKMWVLINLPNTFTINMKLTANHMKTAFLQNITKQQTELESRLRLYSLVVMSFLPFLMPKLILLAFWPSWGSNKHKYWVQFFPPLYPILCHHFQKGWLQVKYATY